MVVILSRLATIPDGVAVDAGRGDWEIPTVDQAPPGSLVNVSTISTHEQGSSASPVAVAACVPLKIAEVLATGVVKLPERLTIRVELDWYEIV